MMTQGERVRTIRKELGLTLEKFGEKIGMRKSGISRIENGKNALSNPAATAICREYNVNYDYLIYGEGEMFTELPETILDELCMEYDLDNLDREIIKIYLKMPEEMKTFVKDELRSMFLETEKE